MGKNRKIKVKRSDQKSGVPFLCACQKGIIIITLKKSNTSHDEKRRTKTRERERENQPQITHLSPF